MQLLWRTITERFLKKMKIENYLAIPLVGIYLEKTEFKNNFNIVKNTIYIAKMKATQMSNNR